MSAEAGQEQSNLLKNLVPLNALSEEHLGQLISRIRLERMAAGGFLFREGDTDHEHVYLLEGRVSLLSGGKTVDTVQSGSNTARFALAHQWPRKFSVRAAGAVRIARIDSHALSDLLVRTQTQSYRVSDLDTDSSGDWMSQVLRSGVFQQIPAANIQGVLRRMESITVETGECVINQDAEGDFYYVIIRGAATVTRTRNGRIRELARLGVGQGFGEQALITGNSRNSSVSMLEGGTLMRLLKEDFEQLIRQPLIKLLDLEAAQKQVEQGAVWLDVRSPGAFADGHPPGAISLPLDALRQEYDGLDEEIDYLAYSGDSGDCEVAAFLLRERGFTAYAVRGEIAGARRDPGKTDRVQPDSGSEIDSNTVPLDAATSSPTDPENGLADGQTDQLLKRLTQSQARFQKALYQRIAEIRQLRHSLHAVTAEKEALAQSLSRLEAENAGLKARLAQTDGTALASDGPLIDAGEQERLRLQVAELQGELDELQDVLQEASAEESRQQWERTRLDARIQGLENSLDEQRQRNEVLREENDETIRRLETLRGRQERSQANDSEGSDSEQA